MEKFQHKNCKTKFATWIAGSRTTPDWKSNKAQLLPTNVTQSVGPLPNSFPTNSYENWIADGEWIQIFKNAPYQGAI